MSPRSIAILFLAVVASAATAGAAVTNNAAWNDATTTRYQFTVGAGVSLTRFSFFVDTDELATTGYQDSVYQLGGNFLIEGLTTATVYSYSGTGTNWAWTSVGTATVTINATTGTYTVAVARTTLGDTNSCVESSAAFVLVTYTSGAQESGSLLQHTYSPASTCAVPVRAADFNPATASLSLSQVVLTMVYGTTSTTAVKTAYIDLDRNSASGVRVTVGGQLIGAEYKLVGTQLFTALTPTTFSSTFSTITFTDSTARSTASWTLSRSLLSDANSCRASYTVAYQISTSTALSSPSLLPLPTSSQTVAVPAYFNPCSITTTGCLWNTFNKYTANTTTLGVLNVNNGPGTASDAGYVSLLTSLKQGCSGSKVLALGYVYSLNGNRPIADVKTDITRWYSWYWLNANGARIDGIFIDEVAPPDCSKVAYYSELVNHVYATAAAKTRSKPLIILNPGTVIEECYMATGADIIVMFEGSYSQYLTWKPAGWENKYEPSRFWHLVYSTPGTTAAFTNAINLSKQRRAGWVYVTDDTYDAVTQIGNPWDSMPGVTSAVTSLWDTEVSNVAAWGTC